VSAKELLGLITDSKTIKKAKRAMRKARGHDSLQALSKLTRVVDGHRIIEDDPPLLVRVLDDEIRERISEILQMYKRTLQDDRRHPLDQYRFVDVARKVVGVASVGTRDFVVLLEGRDGGDPLVLQVKEAEGSVLEERVGVQVLLQRGQLALALLQHRCARCGLCTQIVRVCRRCLTTRIIVSEPLVDLPGAWNEVPESSYGVVQEGEDELHPFQPRF
jgi:uncharacterized protein (DUF2252 family)